jgi:serine phosphatase RsbU (regulator of sigma subunit)
LKNHKLNAKEINQKLIKQVEKFKEDKEYVDDIAILTAKIY